MTAARESADRWRVEMQESWERLRVQSEAIQDLEPRARDVLWPLFNYASLDVELFDASTMCLLANDDENKLYVNARMISDMYEQVAEASLAVTWFWTHQMVHVTQGLTYQAFRTLNTEPDRVETTRADVWADFISLKTLAIFELLDRCGGDECSTGAIRQRQLEHFRYVVWPVMAMRPNFFVPFEREFEVRRVLSLMVFGLLLEADGSEACDDSVFVNWRSGMPDLYVWYGQTSLLGRRPIACTVRERAHIVSAIQEGRYEEARDRIAALPFPRGVDLRAFFRAHVP